MLLYYLHISLSLRREGAISISLSNQEAGFWWGWGGIYPSIKEVVGGGGLRRDGRVLLLSIYQCVMYIRSVNEHFHLSIYLLSIYDMFCVCIFILFLSAYRCCSRRREEHKWRRIQSLYRTRKIQDIPKNSKFYLHTK